MTGAPVTLTATADGFITVAGETRTLAGLTAIFIRGTAGDDLLALDLGASLAIMVRFDGGAGRDTLVGPGRDATWVVAAPDAGHVAGVTFVSVENVTGAPGNRDTFVVGAGGSISGLIDGGQGGFDTLVVDGGGAAIVATVTGPQAGTITRGSDVLAYTGLEPISVTGTTAVTVNAPDTATVIVADSGTTSDRTFTIDFNGGGETHSITAADTIDDLTINLGGGPSTVTVNALDPAFDGNLTINGGMGDDTVIFGARTGSGVFMFNGGDGTDTVSATRNADFVLATSQLTVGTDAFLLSGVESATLTGGDGDNSFTVGGFTGSGTIAGGDGTGDTILATRDASFTLTDSQLSVGPDVFLISGIERATLTAGAGANTFTVGAFTGSAYLAGLEGDDRYVFGPDEMGSFFLDEYAGGVDTDRPCGEVRRHGQPLEHRGAGGRRPPDDHALGGQRPRERRRQRG